VGNAVNAVQGSTLLVSPCLYEPNYGGVQFTAQVAWRALSAESAQLLCYGTRCVQPAEQRQASQSCAHSKWAALWESVKNRRHETVIFWHLDLLKLLPFFRPRPIRVALFLHGVECWRTLPPREQNLLKQVDVFLSNSCFTWQRFLQKNPGCSSALHRTVPLGCGSAAVEDGNPDEKPMAFMLGRMDRNEDYKGHRELIQIWPDVLRQVPDAELHIAGGGNLQPDLAGLARSLGVGSQVTFCGLISEEEKRRLLLSSRCLLLPSRGEGFGLVYLEAMRLGRPCLVSSCDAGLEVINPPEAGLAADPRNPEALAEATCRLLSHGPEWQGWSERARWRYQSQFTEAAFAQRLLTATRELLA
jgi:phosphatidyl-myo-inositol dimannoside synthase